VRRLARLPRSAVPDSPTPPADAVIAPKPDVDQPSSLAALAALPATSVVALLPSFRLSSPFPLSAPPPSTADLADTAAFVDSLYAQELEAAQVKQKLGERLFKVVKRLASERGIKGAVRPLPLLSPRSCRCSD